ncbi:hypothetical protein [Thermocoleostomius sinensis]|uniref:Uncharacterized protein n=1 Tax=Thermocoleostomius sinensis A174 TaxID=2016057 RepID=A0A9E8ZEN4_9CYAN|nr:hypothetical protein [Thermocoleostomius sinensis]WAL61974.1 hypothetical protein OXH18_08305 [Thermocoleostomius sinensis A174]
MVTANWAIDNQFSAAASPLLHHCLMVFSEAQLDGLQADRAIIYALGQVAAPRFKSLAPRTRSL